MAQPFDQDLQQSPTEPDDVHYIVFIRLPFPRGDFVDPPSVDWNTNKDRELSDLLSKSTAKGRDIDCEVVDMQMHLAGADWSCRARNVCQIKPNDTKEAPVLIYSFSAERFQVSLPFLSQQAALLYERQLSQVRAGLQKANRLSCGASPTPGSVSGTGTAGGYAMTRGGSGGSRVPSSLSHRAKEHTTSHGETSTDFPRLGRRPMSRTASTHTVTQIPASPQTPTERRSSFAQRARSRESSGRSVEASPKQQQRPYGRETSPSVIASDSSSSSSSDNAPPQMSRSRAFARRPRYSSSKTPLNPLSDADEEDEDSPPFLPFSDARPITPPAPTDPSSTLKVSPKRPPSHQPPPVSLNKPKVQDLPQTAHSSSSSVQSQPQSQNRPPQHSPLSALSPRQRRIAKEGSEGTPSMGSSFSDLDDASVTQSALEEHLANEMTHGSVASRMSTISQALRSSSLVLRKHAALDVHVGSSGRSHSLERDIIVSKIDMLDFDGSPTSLTGPFVTVVLFALSFDADSFAFDGGTCVGRLCLDFDTFQFSNPDLGMRQ
ncbi:MAG: hypothetical protein Q9175_005568 [Cornicularia normoerica]